MSRFSYELDALNDPTLGLIVLQTDETLEQDIRQLIAPGLCRLHVTRIRSGDDLTPDIISDMEIALPAAAELLPPAAQFDAVAYACTSATAQIGADRVHDILKRATGAPDATDPLTATIEALRALNAQRIGVVTPYTEIIAAPLLKALQVAGFDVARSLSFGEIAEAHVVRISASSVREAVASLRPEDGLDAIFLSCTNLRTLELIPTLEAQFGVPVISSNLALTWHLMRLAGLPDLTMRSRLIDGTKGGIPLPGLAQSAFPKDFLPGA